VLPDLRAITLKALMQAGGVEYLAQQAVANPGPFLGLLGRVMPREAHIEMSGELRVRQEVRRDLVEKFIALMQLPASNDASMQTLALPALTHNPDTLLKGQVIADREGLSRRAQNARRESAGTIAGAVQRAAAMQMEQEENDSEAA
jgi:hypothetical protein